MTPEFSRGERLDAIGARARTVTIEANASERAALAKRFALIAIDALAATLTMRREMSSIVVEGRLTAAVRQACIVTDAPVEAELDEPLALRFVDEGEATQEEIELTSSDLDLIPLEGDAIDLGEAVAETMALALDPFPRAPGAADALRAAGVLSEDEVRPTNAFAALKEAMMKK